VSARVRIALADDHPIVLGGLRSLIEKEADFELVGEAISGLAALRVISTQLPDVAVVDISLPELNGISLTRRVVDTCPSVRVLILTLHEDRAYVRQAFEVGARGYVLKRTASENLIQAVRAVYVGGLYIDPALVGHVFDGERTRSAVPPEMALGPELTARETEVLRLTALGHSNKEIARRLDVGVKSVETYKARGAEKLGLKSRAEIVRFASAQGWLADV